MSVSIGGLVVVALLLVMNIFLGVIVILRNPRGLLNRAFLLMVSGITLWATSSTLSDASSNFTVSRYASFVAFGGSFFGFCATYIFSEVFRHEKLQSRHFILLFFGTLISVLFATPLVYDLDTINTYHNGPLYIPYIVSVIIVLGCIIRNFYMVIRRGSPSQRSQARLIIIGFVSMAVLALITNAVIPALVDVTWVTKIGPLFTTLFIGGVAYSMIRHRLFDIRAVVARALGYAASIFVLASLYGFFVFGLARLFFDLQLSFALLAFLSITTGVAGLLFQKLRRSFDRTTNRIFYHDAYDPQELFDQLNKVLVSSLNLDHLLKQASRVITLNIKSGFCFFAIRENPEEKFRVAGTIEPDYDLAEIAKARKLMTMLRRPVVAADDLDDSQEALKGLLDKNNIAVLARLSQTVKGTDEGLGYLVLGPKKSGNPYNSQDMKVINTVAKELVIAIQNALHFEEIQNFNLTLQSRVERATSQLRKTNQKLQDLDETKDDFISMASHQLRTPLTSVKGYISIVMDGDAGKVTETQATMLKQAFNSSQRMVYLIADLLNVSRLKTGKFIIEPAPTDLSQLVQEEIEQLKDSAELRRMRLTYAKPADFPILMLDETKIRQVIMNFIDNAIYYTPTGGHIDVRLVNLPTSVEFRVVDDGIGVPKVLQHNLFNKFYRAPNAQRARPDGTGLGLFMAKKVIVAEGGAILFESVEGKGSTFGFAFSKAAIAPPPSVTGRATRAPKPELAKV